MKALLALLRADLVLYFSNRRAIAVTFLAPVLIAAFFGSVMGGDGTKRPARVPVAVVDQDRGPLTTRIVARMKKDDNFDVRELALDEAIPLVRAGKIRAAIVFPAGFGHDAPRAMFRSEGKPAIDIHVDPSQNVSMALVKGLLAQHVMQEVAKAAFGFGEEGSQLLADARKRVDDSTQLSAEDRRELGTLIDTATKYQQRRASTAGDSNGGGFTLQQPFETHEREVTSGERKYNGYSHSFAGMGVQFVLFTGIDLGVGILLMRRLGLWRRLRVAPLSRAVLIGSRVASGSAIATILMFAIYAAGIAIFNVRVDGSWIGFALVIVAFAVLTSTFGLLIASIGRTPEATRGISILATLLLVMLGGAWVPTFIFPEWLQKATLVVPTRWAIDGLEAVTWRGLGLEAALPAVGVMLLFSIAFAAIAVACFRWEE